MRRLLGATLLLAALTRIPLASGGRRFLKVRRFQKGSAAISASAAAVNEAYEVELSNYDNVQYSAPFSIGSQTLPVIYDTGSFEIIVLSTLCETCAQNHVVYDRAKSGSFVDAGGVVAEHLFGSGPVRSEKGFEKVSVGDDGSALTVESAPFWQVVSHEIDVWDENAHFSGIIGLGHLDHIPEGFGSAESSHSDRTLLSTLGVSHFAICLGRSEYGAPGKLHLWQSPTALPRQFTPLQVHGNVHWGVQMTNLKVEGLFSGPSLCSPSCGAIIDSGTSLIAAPPSARSFVDAVGALVKKDCSNLHELPVIDMQLDQLIIQLPPNAYVMQVTNVNQGSDFFDSVFGGSGSEMECVPAFMEIDKDSDLGPVWVLGMPFLRYYHTIFDRVAKQLHVAPSSPTCELEPAMPHLVATNGTNGVTVFTSSFSSLDFKPNLVDLAGIRHPSWEKARLTSAGQNNTRFLKL